MELSKYHITTRNLISKYFTICHAEARYDRQILVIRYKDFPKIKVIIYDSNHVYIRDYSLKRHPFHISKLPIMYFYVIHSKISNYDHCTIHLRDDTSFTLILDYNNIHKVPADLLEGMSNLLNLLYLRITKGPPHYSSTDPGRFDLYICFKAKNLL